MATVDVIIPFYNTPIAFVEQALASLRAQTLTDWHACLVNDGSDATLSLQLERLLSSLNDPRIHYCRTPNRGAAAARNHAIAATHSPYIALLDADDRYHPHMLQTHIDLLAQHPDIDVVYGDQEVIDADGAITESAARVVREAGRYGMNELSQRDLFVRMAERNFIGCLTTIFRRRCLAGGTRFDETPDSIEDKVFWLELMGRGCKFHHINATVAQYRRHGSNTSRNIDKLLRGRKLLYRKIPALARTAVGAAGDAGAMNRLRRALWRHMYAEAAWGYRTQRRYARAALAYCLKHAYVFDSLLTPDSTSA